ncbi:MAG: hypothetical protein ACOCWM_04290, partial [Cyclobacteriaceae bacterium]
LIINYQPKRILEWGSGYSTLFFPSLLKHDFFWLSIENNLQWVQHLQSQNSSDKIVIKYIPEDSFPWSDKNNDGSYQDLKSYIDYPKDFKPYDFIFIDGRARRDCLEKALEYLQNEGIVVLHDANRTYYYEGIEGKLGNFFILKDYRNKSGGLLMAAKNISIEKYLDYNKHEKNWNLINNLIGKWLAI